MVMSSLPENEEGLEIRGVKYEMNLTRPSRNASKGPVRTSYDAGFVGGMYG